MDIDPIVLYIALSAIYMLFFSFIPSVVYRILIIRLIGFYYSLCLDISCIWACLLRQSSFQ